MHRVLSYIWRVAWDEADRVTRFIEIASIVVPSAIGVAAHTFHWKVSGFPNWYWFVVAFIALLVVVMLSIARRALTLEDQQKPTIKIQGLDVVDAPLTPTIPGTGGNPDLPKNRNSRWVKVIVENDGHDPARHCQPYLHEVQFSDDGGKSWQDAGFGSSPMVIKWAEKPEADKTKPMDLLNSISAPFEIVWVDEKNEKLILQTHPKMNRHSELLMGFGKYRFTVSVVGDTAKSEKAKVEIDYNGKWNELTAEMIE